MPDTLNNIECLRILGLQQTLPSMSVGGPFALLLPPVDLNIILNDSDDKEDGDDHDDDEELEDTLHAPADRYHFADMLLETHDMRRQMQQGGGRLQIS